MKLLNFNTAWAKPGTAVGKRVGQILVNADADLICLTEAFPELIAGTGHTITCDDRSGYVYPDDRKKVLLWSREPWSDVSTGEDSEVPGGRFVSGVTQGMRVVGICIPWHMAHVTTGMRNRKMWEDHISYLKHLRPILEGFLTHSEPLIVVGDWNQRIAQPSASKSEAQLALMEGIPAALEIVTQGEIAAIGGRLIDHLAISKPLKASDFIYFGPRTQDGKSLSDHVGYTVEVR
ncbi:MAG: endonuclease/exonuclease/phosphatase family protein [Verrucomicrobiota bacterium]